MSAGRPAAAALIDAMHEAGELLEWDTDATPHSVRLALAERIVSVLSDAIYLGLAEGDDDAPEGLS